MSLTDVFPFLHQGEDSADKPETSANVNSKPPKSDAEQTVELLAKIVDEVKLDQRLPNQGNGKSSIKTNLAKRFCPHLFLDALRKSISCFKFSDNCCLALKTFMRHHSTDLRIKFSL
jgi:hypothetical protein